ncbi:hypothetical protein K505DRAFT_385427 [Melanomma pulvis-pyrius CBS 109.77]|uniref:Uncharacterized protein n=1 Tax=Melanomma pulvis-pyrius CBS 109.77 TaxID=1314802 RepID=A0A6A6XB87_9PLEO|nr:hypothetical protein K505DRAFT_385427 [Melanomma pulvis-pyrius CBS 109.77]
MPETPTIFHCWAGSNTSTTSTTAKPPSVFRYTLILLKARPSFTDISALSSYSWSVGLVLILVLVGIISLGILFTRRKISPDDVNSEEEQTKEMTGSRVGSKGWEDVIGTGFGAMAGPFRDTGLRGDGRGRAEEVREKKGEGDPGPDVGDTCVLQ